MKTFFIVWLMLLSVSLNADDVNEHSDSGLDEAFLIFLSEWGQIKEGRDKMLVFDSLLERQSAGMEKNDAGKGCKKSNESKKCNEAKHDQ